MRPLRTSQLPTPPPLLTANPHLPAICPSLAAELRQSAIHIAPFGEFESFNPDQALSLGSWIFHTAGWAGKKDMEPAFRQVLDAVQKREQQQQSGGSADGAQQQEEDGQQEAGQREKSAKQEEQQSKPSSRRRQHLRQHLR